MHLKCILLNFFTKFSKFGGKSCNYNGLALLLSLTALKEWGIQLGFFLQTCKNEAKLPGFALNKNEIAIGKAGCCYAG